MELTRISCNDCFKHCSFTGKIDNPIYIAIQNKTLKVCPSKKNAHDVPEITFDSLDIGDSSVNTDEEPDFYDEY